MTHLPESPQEPPPNSQQEAQYGHTPVMAPRVIELLVPAVAAGGVVVDATLGLGGHAESLLQAAPRATVIGVDQDPQALEIATGRLARFGTRFVALQGNFEDAVPLVEDAGWSDISAFLFDLGVSSLQLDSDARGFAYARDTDLDMRMDPHGSVSAQDVVNNYSPEELERVISQYGEERFARRIARAIDRRRRTDPITTSAQLSAVVADAIPHAARRKGHPAKRVFQALRIEVNDELGVLRAGLTAAVRSVRVGGRVVVLSYHSLEDRIVKRTFAGGIRPYVHPDLPIVPDSAQPFLTALTRGAEIPTAAEIASNRRAAPAKMRAVEKTRPVPAEWQGAA